MNLQNIIIETERLRLIPPSMDYREDVFREFQEPVTRFIYSRPAEKIEETEVFIQRSLEQRKEGTDLIGMIVDKNTNVFLGCAGLHHLDTDAPELGIWIKQSVHGNKYGLEAMRALKQWAEEKLQYDHLCYPVVAENIASCKLAEALGGKVSREYERTMQSGRIYKMIDYWIPKKEEFFNVLDQAEEDYKRGRTKELKNLAELISKKD